VEGATPNRPATTAPPAGSRPKLTTAPLRAGGAQPAFRPSSATAPRTKRYDTEIHECQAEDTWEKLSTRYYGDDRCAAALRAFNRNCPWTTTLAKRDGLLAPGEKIHIPPLKVLEEEYDSLIRAAPAAPVPPPSTR
jgi:hypothetical protein